MSKLLDLTNKHDSSSFIEFNRGKSTYSVKRKQTKVLSHHNKPYQTLMSLNAEAKFDKLFGAKTKSPVDPFKVVLKPANDALTRYKHLGYPRYRSSDDESEPSSPECKKTSVPAGDLVVAEEEKPKEEPTQIKLFDSNEELPPIHVTRISKRKTITANKTLNRKTNEPNRSHATDLSFKPLLNSTNIETRTPNKSQFKAPQTPLKFSTPCHKSLYPEKEPFALLVSPILKEKRTVRESNLIKSKTDKRTSRITKKATKTKSSKSIRTDLSLIEDPSSTAACVEPQDQEKSPNKSISESSVRRKSLNNSLKILAEQFLHKNSEFCKKMADPDVTAKCKLLSICEPTQTVRFSSALPKTTLASCQKIAEGSYGEIFRTNGNSIIKIVTVQNDQFDQLLPEVLVSLAFNQLQERCENFICTSRCIFVTGPYPKALEQEWHRYNKQHKSLNTFPSGNQHLLFTLDNGGECLENYSFESIQQAVSVFEQVLCSLAMAERAFSFEHRDLHWGNVLISPEAEPTFSYRLGSKQFTVSSHGIYCRIIDFSLSRASIDQMIFHCDLSKDSTLFSGKGDRQFDIYRQMRSICNDDWKQYCPRTNILWLHYLLDKLIFKSRTLRRRDNALDANRRLRFYSTNILKYDSAEHAMEALLTN